MNDTVMWCVAVLLVGACVAAEVFLAFMFFRDWQSDRASRRASHTRSQPRAVTNHRTAGRRHRLHCVAVAAVGLAATVANVQRARAQPADTAPAEDSATQAVQSRSGDLSSDAAAGNLGFAISVQFNLDFTNSYYYRGIRQQDKGLIVQPAARFTTRLVESEDFTLDGFFGVWNSFGSNGGSSTSDLSEDWYEADLYGGLTATRGKLAFTASYTFLTSPSDAFETVQELGFTLALDDSEWLKEWALKPYATLAFETGADASDGGDSDPGVYLELGVAPALSFDIGKTPVALAFPASVGLSLSDYYQDASGSDDTFGFAQVGAKASIPLGEPGRFGAWTLNMGVSVLFLGDHTEDYNSGESTELIGMVGLQVNF